MSNILKELKAEIARLARKEAKQVVAPVKKASANYRGLIAGLRKQIDVLQGEVAALRRAAPKGEKTLAVQEPAGRFWITGSGVKTLRTRLGLTQQQFAGLAGVSSQAVFRWERNKGKVNLRKAAAGKLQGLRGIGKRDVAGMVGKGVKGKANAKPKARRKTRSTTHDSTASEEYGLAKW